MRVMSANTDASSTGPTGEHGFGEHAAAGEEQFAPLGFGRMDLRRGLLHHAACVCEGENGGLHQGGDFIASCQRLAISFQPGSQSGESCSTEGATQKTAGAGTK